MDEEGDEDLDKELESEDQEDIFGLGKDNNDEDEQQDDMQTEKPR